VNEKPIFIQLIEMIEDGIISGVYNAGDLVISSTQICKLYKVNPATAMRALAVLADNGIIIKDRGIGMRVTDGAKAVVAARRSERFFGEILKGLLAEAEKLNIGKEQLIDLIEKNYKENGDDTNN